MATLTLRDIKIVARKDLDRPKKAGDFDVYMQKDGKALFLPKDLFNFLLMESNVGNTQGFFDCIIEMPQTMARFLKWRIEDLENARRKLIIYVQQVLGRLNSIPRTKE